LAFCGVYRTGRLNNIWLLPVGKKREERPA
jgi:hypothetical protein